MAIMVCRGHQPCVDSQFIETTWPRLAVAPPHFNNPQLSTHPLQFAFKSCFLDLHFDSSKSLHESPDPNLIVSHSQNSTNDALPNKSDDAKKSAMATKNQEQPPYVHPLVKRSRSTLSHQSLALCTEDLGNETGADFADDAIFSDLKIHPSPTRKRVKSDNNNNQGNKKLFPPPLTTIAGVDSVRLRSYREDGRLIMEAVKAPARLSYFQVERSHGRLRLSILKSSSTPKFDSKEEEAEVEEEETPNDDVEVMGEEGNCEEDPGGKVEENRNVRGAEIEIEKLQRPCRCNERKKGGNNNIHNNKNNHEMLSLTREPLSLRIATS